MHIESPDGSEPGRKQNRNRGNLGGKKEQMRKITTVSIISLILTLATGLILPLLSGCDSRSKMAMTTVAASSYDGGGTRRGFFGDPNKHRLTGASNDSLLSTGDEVWIIARRERGDLPSQD